MLCSPVDALVAHFVVPVAALQAQLKRPKGQVFQAAVQMCRKLSRQISCVMDDQDSRYMLVPTVIHILTRPYL